MGLFKKAVMTESKLRLAIAGPSGAGKTYSALAIATGLGGPIAVIDTEHGSASKYSSIFDFDVAEMHAPYHPRKYIDAIKEAAEAGYKVVVIDSLSHAWNGEGGVLQLVEDAAARNKGGNSFAAWKDVTPIQTAMVEAMVMCPIHIIVTMRSKQEYVQGKNEKGYTVINKVGMAPVQRDGMEYEFDVFLDMTVDNKAVVSKSRCVELNGQVINKPGKPLADTLKKWLSAEPAQKAPEPTQTGSTPSVESEQGATAIQWAMDGGMTQEEAQEIWNTAVKVHGGKVTAANTAAIKKHFKQHVENKLDPVPV